MKWTLFLLLVVGAVVLATAQQDLEEDNELFADEQDEASTAEDNSSNEEDDDDQVNLRVVRSAPSETTGKGRNRGSARTNAEQGDRRRRGEGKACRYNKGAWTECDTATNQRSRSLTLKKGDSTCESSKIITKKCKKGGAGGAGRRNRNWIRRAKSPNQLQQNLGRKIEIVFKKSK